MHNHFIIGCESFATNFASVRPAVCVDFFMTYHQISSLEILGTKCTLKRPFMRVDTSNMKCHKHFTSMISSIFIHIAFLSKQFRSNFRSCQWVSSLPVCAHSTVMLVPALTYANITFKQLSQLIRSHTQSSGTLRQLLKIHPFLHKYSIVLGKGGPQISEPYLPSCW